MAKTGPGKGDLDSYAIGGTNKVAKRYHPACLGMTIARAKQLDKFVCSGCSSDDVKKPQSALPESFR